MPSNYANLSAHDFFKLILLPSYERACHADAGLVDFVLVIWALDAQICHIFADSQIDTNGLGEAKGKKILRRNHLELDVLLSTSAALKHAEASRKNNVVDGSGRLEVAILGYGEMEYGVGEWGSTKVTPEVTLVDGRTFALERLVHYAFQWIKICLASSVVPKADLT